MIRTRMYLSVLALAATVALIPLPATGQITAPRVSPHAVAQQTIGISEVTIDYHRPQIRDREVWGALVPYDNVWRAGANDNTVIVFSHDVKIEGKPLAAGTYGLHMIPSAGPWTVVFSTNSTSWGSFSYDEKEDALRVQVKPTAAPLEEWLSYGFEDLSATAATAYVHWEKLKVPFRVEVNTPEVVLGNMRNELRSTAGFQWQSFLGAANYALQNTSDLEQALTWAERAVAMQESGRTLGLKALILGRLGRGEEAEATLEKAVEVATEAELNFLGYALLGAGKADQAIELFQTNVDRHSDSWNVWDSLAEAQGNGGDKKSAIKSYSKALSLAPDDQKSRIEAALRQLKGM